MNIKCTDFDNDNGKSTIVEEPEIEIDSDNEELDDNWDESDDDWDNEVNDDEFANII